MKIEIGTVEIDLYQLLVHDAWDCGRVDPAIICEEVNGLLSVVYTDAEIRLVSPDDNGLRRFTITVSDWDDKPETFPAQRVYSVEEAKESLPPWLRRIVDDLNKLEV